MACASVLSQSPYPVPGHTAQRSTPPPGYRLACNVAKPARVCAKQVEWARGWCRLRQGHVDKAAAQCHCTCAGANRGDLVGRPEHLRRCMHLEREDVAGSGGIQTVHTPQMPQTHAMTNAGAKRWALSGAGEGCTYEGLPRFRTPSKTLQYPATMHIATGWVSHIMALCQSACKVCACHRCSRW